MELGQIILSELPPAVPGRLIVTIWNVHTSGQDEILQPKGPRLVMVIYSGTSSIS